MPPAQYECHASFDTVTPAASTPGNVAPAPIESVHALFLALYPALCRLARSRLAVSGRDTLLDTSALVHEAFLRMQRDGGVPLADREHFLAYAATTMRNVVVDFVRRQRAARRGGDIEHVPLENDAPVAGGADPTTQAVHDALATLGQVDARLVRVVEMRYFTGLSDSEIGALLGVTERTVRRDWERARALLAGWLSG